MRTKRGQSVHLEVEGETVAAGCPKCQTFVKVAAPYEKAKRNRKKQKTLSEIPPIFEKSIMKGEQFLA